MLASTSSWLGWSEDPPRDPPPVTITGVRIPADGSPAHLVKLTTTSDGVGKGSDCYMFHVPDLRQYWKSERAWLLRGHQRLEMNQQPHASCNGLFMAFFSFAADDLRENTSLPRVIGTHRTYWGDVFFVKLAPHESGHNRWAAYEDISPEFLELQVMDPSFQPVIKVLSWAD